MHTGNISRRMRPCVGTLRPGTRRTSRREGAIVGNSGLEQARAFWGKPDVKRESRLMSGGVRYDALGRISRLGKGPKTW